MADRNSEKGGGRPSPVQDLLEQLDRVSRQFPGSRLLVDLARDAGLEMARALGKKVKRLKARLERSEARAHSLQSRLAETLHELSTSPAALPTQEGQPPRDAEALLARYRRLRDKAYPALARVLRDLAKGTTRTAFVRFLAEEVLLRAAPVLAEHQLRHAHRPWSAEGEQAFLGDLRQHVAGKVNRSLARAAGLQVMPALGKHLDALISESLEVLLGLMTASPQARLVVPPPGTPVDPVAHALRRPERAGERPLVRVTLFPGLMLLEAPPRAVVAAVVQGAPVAASPSSAALPVATPREPSA